VSNPIDTQKATEIFHSLLKALGVTVVKPGVISLRPDGRPMLSDGHYNLNEKISFYGLCDAIESSLREVGWKKPPPPPLPSMRLTGPGEPS